MEYRFRILAGKKADALLAKLYKGSSVGNPVDFLSTGTAEQMRAITMAMENDFDVDAMCIIFGKPGLGDLYGITDEIMELQKECKKPIYPILTSVVNASDEIRRFQEKGGISFPEEVQFGQAYAKIMNAPAPIEKADLPPVDRDLIRKIVDTAGKGYLPPDKVQELLDAAGIMRAKEFIAHNISEALKAANEIEGPVAMKVVGPIHKSDVGGVTLNVSDNGTVKYEFQRMMKIPDAIGVLIQPMLTGTQIFVGAKRENKFGHIIMCGLGGIYVEVLHDVSTGLSPISQIEANEMIHHLRSYPLIRGIRGQEGVNETILSEVIRRVSALCNAAPEIFEMDINPLMGNSRQLVAVDTRIRIEKE
jgi:acetyltransferase